MTYDKKWESEYFYGNKISDYGLTNGYIDYSTLAKAFDMVLNNNIVPELENKGFYFEMVNGPAFDDENDDACSMEIFQYYIISDRGYEILSEFTNEIVFYNEDLDMYVWGVCHYGTSWDYVLTDIKIDDDVVAAYKEGKKRA